MRIYQLIENTIDFSRPIEYNKLRTVKFGDTTIHISVPPEGPIHIDSIRTPQSKRGKGSARVALQQLINKADETGETLELDASALDKKTSTSKLVKFYASMGFKLTGRTVNILGEPVMIREPQ